MYFYLSRTRPEPYDEWRRIHANCFVLAIMCELSEIAQNCYRGSEGREIEGVAAWRRGGDRFGKERGKVE